ncbi:PepSY domain-containing protein [Thalassotalea sp. 1_MG-2023]|uniref:PepSY domain-containing protein n=1 Tax=Thalassotalea sp. 1_MG-2023 TaxID=3062680 RepID=UPI0026E12DD5|nr:PepSY domain-containing protein [Thalassotalea sp. 1_MG-2023]MDO6428286.1 PepSY domain-containing protein [Thalassotalea sp. 1_MG-2023]
MRKIHKILGLIMLLPIIAWAITGTYFFFKPGYQEAYQTLNVKTYPLAYVEKLPKGEWLETKQLNTVLGQHVMLKDKEQWHHFIMPSWQAIDTLSNKQVNALVADAISVNKTRYGKIKSVTNNNILTTTNVAITLNWPQLSLRQQGQDTDFINTMYDIHYLRWTGYKTFDQYLGVFGLLLIVVLAGVGTWMTITRK